jgi:non-heme chloroperoxidase
MSEARRSVSTRDGVSLSVRHDGDGPTVVLFIHGWMVSGAVWDSVLPAIDRAGRTLLVPDLRGTGESDKPSGPYTLERYASDLVAVLDAFGARDAVIVGHSMGGQLALYLAAHAPARVRAVLALCPVPPSGMALPPDAAGLFRNSGADRDKQGTILGLACKSLSDAEKTRLLDDAAKVSVPCIQGAFDAWTGGGFDDKLSMAIAPTVVLATEDPFLPPAFLREAVVNRLARGRLATLPGAGHYPQCERPAECAAVIETFLGAAG